MSRKSSLSHDEAETIALRGLAFLVEDTDRLGRFMAVTGTAPETIRTGAASSGFLGGVLEYLCSDQPLLLIFAESEGIEPQSIEAAARRLEDFLA